MSDRTNHDDDKASAPSASMVFLIFGTIFETTWKLALPPLLGTVIGVWADNTYGTTPWATVAGVTGGSLLAVNLVAQQIRKVQR